MSQPDRPLWGAPGPVSSGHMVDDVTRRALAAAAARLSTLVDPLPPVVGPLLEDVDRSLAEVERMREAMGAERMADDDKRQELRRAAQLGGWVLQQEYAFLQGWFAADDPQAERFSPARALGLGTTWTQRRVARLDALRHAYLENPDVPGAAERAEQLATVGARLFRAIASSIGIAPEPVPLAEARQRFDLAYVQLRDVVRALKVVPAQALLDVFPDLSPSWRLADLRR